MPNPLLAVWMSGGSQNRLGALAKAESRLTSLVQSAVIVPTPQLTYEIRDAAIGLENAAAVLLEGLAEQPSPDAAVNRALRRAGRTYQRAAELIATVLLVDGLPMTVESGEVAWGLIELARKRNWEATMAFVQSEGSSVDCPPTAGHTMALHVTGRPGTGRCRREPTR